MTVLSTEGQYARFSSLVKGGDTPENMRFFIDKVTVVDTAGTTLQPATVLGKVTATGKFVVSKQNAADGSQVPAAIYVGTGTLGEYKETVLAISTEEKPNQRVVKYALGSAWNPKEKVRSDWSEQSADKTAVIPQPEQFS